MWPAGLYVRKYWQRNNLPTNGPTGTNLGGRIPSRLAGMSAMMRLPWQRPLPSNGALNILQLWASGLESCMGTRARPHPQPSPWFLSPSPPHPHRLGPHPHPVPIGSVPIPTPSPLFLSPFPSHPNATKFLLTQCTNHQIISQYFSLANVYLTVC